MLQQVINGILTGSVYALFALGFNLVLGALNILNVAQGAIFTLSAFVAYYLISIYGVPFPLALLAATVAGGGINVLLELLVFRPLRSRGGSAMSSLVASIGASMILISVAQLMSGAQVERFPFGTLPEIQWTEFGMRISFTQVLVLVTTMVTMAGTYILLNRTRLGKAIRTIAFDERIARMLGIPTVSVARWTFFVSGALGGLAGVLLGIMYNSVYFLMGEPYVLKGFAAIVIGGFGSVTGVIVASMMIGLLEVFSTVIGIGTFRDVVTFGVLFLFLLFRPNGLFGRDEEVRP
nr:branched-chain amino acid ABC transporter permease [Microvirga antarctica]